MLEKGPGFSLGLFWGLFFGLGWRKQGGGTGKIRFEILSLLVIRQI
jgi:hypothetical protein